MIAFGLLALFLAPAIVVIIVSLLGKQKNVHP
jgi:hypothetical protein